MSSRQRMTMRAYIQRSSASADSYGHTRPESFAALSTTPCWAWIVVENTNHGDAVSAIATRYRLIMPISTTVTENDRIEKVEDRAATELFGLMYIDAVIRRRDHLEIRCRAHA